MIITQKKPIEELMALGAELRDCAVKWFDFAKNQCELVSFLCNNLSASPLLGTSPCTGEA